MYVFGVPSRNSPNQHFAKKKKRTPFTLSNRILSTAPAKLKQNPDDIQAVCRPWSKSRPNTRPRDGPGLVEAASWLGWEVVAEASSRWSCCTHRSGWSYRNWLLDLRFEVVCLSWCRHRGRQIHPWQKCEQSVEAVLAVKRSCWVAGRRSKEWKWLRWYATGMPPEIVRSGRYCSLRYRDERVRDPGWRRSYLCLCGTANEWALACSGGVAHQFHRSRHTCGCSYGQRTAQCWIGSVRMVGACCHRSHGRHHVPRSATRCCQSMTGGCGVVPRRIAHGSQARRLKSE